jgi:membrane protein DedA with SNARE-associated domain
MGERPGRVLLDEGMVRPAGRLADSRPVETWVIEVLETIGYVGLFALMVAECVFPPMPSEAILPFAGFLIGEGRMSFPLALGASTAGSVVGNLALYLAARHGGRAVVLRHGRRVGCPPERLARLEMWTERWGGLTVLGGRAVPLVRSAVSVPAGLGRYPLGRFLLLTTAGAAVWNGTLLAVGWALDDAWHQVETVLGPASAVVVVLLLGATAWFAFRHLRRRRAAVAAGRPG